MVTQTGGQIHSSGTISIGYGGDLTNDSAWSISGGTLDASNLIVARNGNGRLCLEGNAASVAVDNLYVGGYNGALAHAELEYKVGANGVTAIQVADAVDFELGDASSTAVLLVSLLAAPPAEAILLVDNQGTGAVNGTFDFLNGGSAGEGASVVLDFGDTNYQYTLTYQGVAGADGIANDIMLVPEPATVLLLASGGLFFLRRRRA